MFVNKGEINTSRFFLYDASWGISKKTSIWYSNPPFLVKPQQKFSDLPPISINSEKVELPPPFMKGGGRGDGGRGGWTMVTRPLLFYIARVTLLTSSMEGVKPVTYLLSISQCIISLHVSKVSLMVLNWSSCLNIYKIVPVVVSSQTF